MPETCLSTHDHCQQCTSHCCSNNVFVVKEVEYRRMLDAGHPDYLPLVVLPEGHFYVNDYRGAACPYFLMDFGCTIEKDKPDICQFFPAQVRVNKFGEVTGLGLSKQCRAVPDLTDDFKTEAFALAAPHATNAEFRTDAKIIGLFTDYRRGDPAAAIRANAIIRPALDLQSMS